LETAFEGAGIGAIEDAFEGVVGRNAVREFEKTAQPITPQLAKGLDLLPILGAALASVDARILEFAKVVLNGKRSS
jgi:hypothetical protein